MKCGASEYFAGANQVISHTAHYASSWLKCKLTEWKESRL